MNVTGKNPRMFIGDKEIEGCTSFSLDTGNTGKYETVEFWGVLDPAEKDEVEEHFKMLQAKGEDIITANIYNYDGEKREAQVRMFYQDGQISLEPIDEDVREWVKGWIRAGDKGGLII